MYLIGNRAVTSGLVAVWRHAGRSGCAHRGKREQWKNKEHCKVERVSAQMDLPWTGSTWWMERRKGSHIRVFVHVQSVEYTMLLVSFRLVSRLHEASHKYTYWAPEFGVPHAKSACQWPASSQQSLHHKVIQTNTHSWWACTLCPVVSQIHALLATPARPSYHATPAIYPCNRQVTPATIEFSHSFYLFSRHCLSRINQMAQTPNLGRTSHWPSPT